MKELLRVADSVQLSYLQAVLADAGIAHVVLDQQVGSLIPSAVMPRIMVADEDLARAQAILRDVGETPA